MEIMENEKINNFSKVYSFENIDIDLSLLDLCRQILKDNSTNGYTLEELKVTYNYIKNINKITIEQTSTSNE